MKLRIQFYLILCLLVFAGVGIAGYKVFRLSVPFIPGENVTRWIVEAKITFFATSGNVKARLSLPEKDIANRSVRMGRGSAFRYGFAFDERSGNPDAVWTSSEEKEGIQTLYFRVHVEQGDKPTQEFPHYGDKPVVEPPVFTGLEAVAAEGIVSRVKMKSADAKSFLVHVLSELRASEETQESALLLRRYLDNPIHEGPDEARVALAIDLIRLAGYPARKALGIHLRETQIQAEQVALIEVFDGASWQVYLPGAPEEALPSDLFVWLRGDRPLFDVYGAGENSKAQFTCIKDRIPKEDLANLTDTPLLVSTIQALPVSERSIFKFIVMIPIGAFVVVLMRNVIGIATLGTFMPVLIALSFFQIQNIAVGLSLFAIVIGVGLYFRFLLSRLNLLVVPRVAACVVIVTLLMMVMSVASFKLGYAAGMGITLFPMIILAWTIERMSLIWEEEGRRSALTQVAGSLVVAVVAYLFMANSLIQYWGFYFPELLLVVLALILLLGRYTGYRLLELHRFRQFEFQPIAK